MTDSVPIIPLFCIMRPRITVLLSLICLMGISQDLPVTFHRYSPSDGLSDKWVFSILHDQRGFLWIGTWDGLNQFDGRDFKVFMHDDEDPNTPCGKEIKCLAEDPEGMIWMGTERGLSRMEPLNGRFMRAKVAKEFMEKLSFRAIHSLAADTAGHRLWAGGNGLFYLIPGTEELLPAKGNMNDSLFYRNGAIINGMICDRGKLWLASSQGILVYDIGSGTWEKLAYRGPNPPPPGIGYINNIYMDELGDIWAVSWGAGLLQIDRQTKAITAFYLPQPGFSDASHNILNGIAQTNYPGEETLLWIVGVSGGLMSFDRQTKQFRFFGDDDPENPRSTYRSGSALCFHPASGLWTGTELGLYRYDYFHRLQTTFVPFQDQSGKSGLPVFMAFAEANPADPTGKTLFLGTNNQGFYHFKTETQKTESLNHLFGSFLPENIFVSDVWRAPAGD